MSATLAWAITMAAMTPTLAGDVPDRPPAFAQPARTITVATAPAREAGRLAPRRVPGWPAWRCRVPGAVKGRAIVCSVEASTHAVAVSVRYRTAGGRSTTRVVARLLPRRAAA